MARLLLVARNPALAFGLAGASDDIIEVRPTLVGRLDIQPSMADVIVIEQEKPDDALATLDLIRTGGLAVPALLVASARQEWKDFDPGDRRSVAVLDPPITPDRLTQSVGHVSTLPSPSVAPAATPAGEDLAQAVESPAATAAPAPEPESATPPPAPPPLTAVEEEVAAEPPKRRFGRRQKSTPAKAVAAAAAAEQARLAEETRRAEEAKAAEEERLAAEAKTAEEARIAEETRLAEEARQAEEARLQAEREAAEAKAAEEARLAEEARQAEKAKAGEAARLAKEARVAERAKAAEEARLAKEAKAAEEARLAEEARAAEEARLQAEREAAEAKAAEEARLAEEAKAAEEARLQAEHEAAEAKAVEEARLQAEREAAEAKAAEEARLAEEAKAAEEARLAEGAKAAEEARLQAEREAAEAKAEQAHLEEEARLKEEEPAGAEQSPAADDEEPLPDTPEELEPAEEPYLTAARVLPSPAWLDEPPMAPETVPEPRSPQPVAATGGWFDSFPRATLFDDEDGLTPADGPSPAAVTQAPTLAVLAWSSPMVASPGADRIDPLPAEIVVEPAQPAAPAIHIVDNAVAATPVAETRSAHDARFYEELASLRTVSASPGTEGTHGTANGSRPTTVEPAPYPGSRLPLDVIDLRGAQADDARSTPALVRALLSRVHEVYGVGESGALVVDDALARTGATAAALLLPDGEVWRVAAGKGLRRLEERYVLMPDSWLVTTIADRHKGIIIDRTDVARRPLAGAPLAAHKHLVAAPVRDVGGILLIARDEDPPFGERDLLSLATLAEAAAGILAAALDARQLARLLNDLRDADERVADRIDYGV